MSENQAVVSIKNTAIYQQKNLVLSDVNFQVMPGEFVYLIGKTGSGKSSLLRTLYADLDLREGQIEVVGFDLGKMKSRKIPQLRRKLGIVFQDFQLLGDRSVAENLIFVMKATGWKDKKQMKQRVHDVLDKVDLSTKGFKMPHELSGGEQQRVAIARSLINEPELIIADEPTGNLDPETSNGILKLLLEISQNGTAVLIATHDYSLIEKYPARIIKCEFGKVSDSAGASFTA